MEKSNVKVDKSFEGPSRWSFYGKTVEDKKEKNLCPECQKASENLKIKFPEPVTQIQVAQMWRDKDFLQLVHCHVCNKGKDVAKPIMQYHD